MKLVLVLVCVIFLWLRFYQAETVKAEESETTETLVDSLKTDKVADDIESAIENIEATFRQAKKIVYEGINRFETNKYYTKIVESLEEVTEKAKVPSYAYNFIKSKGIDRIIMPILKVHHSEVKEQSLILLKTLFEVASSTTKAVTPIKVLDELLDIFEDDTNLRLKTHVLDLLYVWLPGNPKAQLRVMKLKGLETFYHQVSKIDKAVIAILLELFNKILVEHINVRNVGEQKSPVDPKVMLYQRTRLIERISTPEVCNGLLDVFQTALSNTVEDHEVIVPIFQLINNIRPLCVKVLKGNKKAVDLFETLLEYVEDDSREVFFESLDLNVEDLKAVLEEFLSELKHPSQKDEF